jgi:hypothetical protein
MNAAQGENYYSPPTTTLNTAGKNGNIPTVWDNGEDKVGEVTETKMGNTHDLMHGAKNFGRWDCSTQQFVTRGRVYEPKQNHIYVQKCHIFTQNLRQILFWRSHTLPAFKTFILHFTSKLEARTYQMKARVTKANHKASTFINQSKMN